MARDFINSNNCYIGSWSQRVSCSFEKIGSYFGKLKNTISNFQREVNSVTENVDIEKDITQESLKKEKRIKKMSDNNSFTSHFVELRSRLIRSLIFIFVVFVISYTFADYIYSLVSPYAEAVKDDSTSRRLIFTALHETFITYLKVAFFSAIFLGSPFLLIQIYKFIAPGLYKNEKSFITLLNFYTNTFFIGWHACLLFSNAFSY